MASEQMTISPPLAASADVVVVGSGTAGACAAIAAARLGASVVLIEKQGFMGGTSTAVLDTFYGFYTPGSRSIKIAGGISDEVVAGLRALGPVLERPNTYGAGTGVTYNAEHLKLVWEQLAVEAGVRVLLHAFLQDVTVRDGRVGELLVATKAGLVRIAGRVFVDASGDADLACQAGFGYELAGALDPAQTLTTTFKMVNVDIAARKRIEHDGDAPADGQGRGLGRLRPAAPRGLRSHHTDRGHDGHGDDPPALVPRRGRRGHQRYRPGAARRGRDARVAVRRSSTPGSCTTWCPATSTPRWYRSRHRSACARPAVSTATTA